MPRPAYGERTATELDVATLGALLLGVANELAGSFDARNGTGHHSGRMAAWLAERPLAAPVPLPTDDEPDEPDEPDADRPDHDAEAELGDAELSALSLGMITGILDGRGDRYLVDEGETVVGHWEGAVDPVPAGR